MHRCRLTYLFPKLPMKLPEGQDISLPLPGMGPATVQELVESLSILNDSESMSG